MQQQEKAFTEEWLQSMLAKQLRAARMPQRGMRWERSRREGGRGGGEAYINPGGDEVGGVEVDARGVLEVGGHDLERHCRDKPCP